MTAAARVNFGWVCTCAPACSAVEAERDHERANLRIVEVVQPLRQELRATQVGLGVEAGILPPRVPVAPGDARGDGGEAAEHLRDAAVQGVGDRKLAQLRERTVLDELRAH